MLTMWTVRVTADEHGRTFGEGLAVVDTDISVRLEAESPAEALQLAAAHVRRRQQRWNATNPEATKGETDA